MPVRFLEIHPEERALRQHIQRHTLAYAQTHITTDHVWYTETAVGEIFSTCLGEVSESGPTDIAFPIDPLDKLVRTEIEQYEERFELSSKERDAVQQRVIQILATRRGRSRATQSVRAESPDLLETPRRRLSPILTATAQKRTVKLLHRSRGQILGMLPTELPESVDQMRIHPLLVDDIPLAKIEDEPLLDVRYTMRAGEVDAFRSIVQRVRGKAHPTGLVDFLRTDSPPIPPYFPRRMSPPLFTRETHRDDTRPTNLAQLGIQLGTKPARVDDGFGLDHIAQEHMKVLCGEFDLLPPSSPPPLSHPAEFTSSDAAQASSPPRTPRVRRDERAFMVSSSPTARQIKIAKLDEILFPSGQRRGRAPREVNPPKFADMMANLHHPIPIPPIATIQVPSSPSTDSIAGQADEETDQLADDPSLVDDVIHHLTKGLDTDPFDFVMKEELDDAVTLPAPDLPAPNEGCESGPMVLGDIVSGADVRMVSVKSLQIELSWRINVPGVNASEDEVAKVAYPVDPDAKHKIKELRTALSPKNLIFSREFVGENVERTQTWARDGLILTREERDKVYGRGIVVDEVQQETQTSFVPLSFGTYGPQSQWNESPPDCQSNRVYERLDDGGERFAGEDEAYAGIQVEPMRVRWADTESDDQHASEGQPFERPEYIVDSSPAHDPGLDYDERLAFEEPMYVRVQSEPARLEWEEDVVPRDHQEHLCGLDAVDPDPTVHQLNRVFSSTPRPKDTSHFDDGESEYVETQPGPAPAEELLANAVSHDRDANDPQLEKIIDTSAIVPRLNHSVQKRIGQFMRFAVPGTYVEPAPTPPHIEVEPEEPPRISEPQSIPSAVLPLLTLLPSRQATDRVRILANINLMTNRTLISALEGPEGQLDLVERSTLDVSLALDPNAALILIPLAELPSPDAIPALSRRLRTLLERWDSIGIVLEARPELESFSPPVIKSLAALKRALALLNGNVSVGIGRDVDEVARIVRTAVDRARSAWFAHSLGGGVWGSREWVGEESDCTDERELGNVVGMNAFAAMTVLAQMTIDEVLDATDEMRMGVLGPSITPERVSILNGVIAHGKARVDGMEVDN